MPDRIDAFRLLIAVLCATFAGAGATRGAEPPAINPFGPPPPREDALPGYVELSDGSVHPGHVHLTRDKRLKIYDQKLKRQREVPLGAVKQIECTVKRQWMEKQWKFKQLASDEKMYTGRMYPAREYLHTITLKDDRTITGPLSGIVYLRPYGAYAPGKPGAYRTPPGTERYLLRKRHKGRIGEKPESLVYVKLIKLGKDALAQGRQKAAEQRSKKRRVEPPAAGRGRGAAAPAVAE